MSLLKGNKKNKLDTWHFRKDYAGKSSQVRVKEKPSYFVTITYVEKDKTPKVTSKELHSVSSVNKVLRQVGIKKPTYPTASSYHENDIYVKKRKLKGSLTGFVER